MSLLTVSVDQTIYAFAATYANGPLGLAAEYYTINDKDEVTEDDFSNNAYYGLITYTLMEKWVPYVMYENLSVEDSVGDVDPYMAALEIGRDTEELTVGLRYNINYRSSVKGEYRILLMRVEQIGMKLHSSGRLHFSVFKISDMKF